MTSPIPSTRLRLIDTIARRVRQRLPKRDWPAAAAITREYFIGVAEEDLAAQGADKLASVLLSNIEFGRRRVESRPSVAVFDADPGTQSPKRTQIFVVCDDMPFLVDSIRSAVTEAGLGVHLIVHPILQLRRRRGSLHSLAPLDAGDGAAESWQWLEIDHEPDAVKRSLLERRILAVLDDVRCAVEDWPAMCARAHEIAAAVRADPSVTSRSEADEVGSLLEWMVDHHFTFLGTRYYRLQRGRRNDQLVADTTTGLGILRPGRDSHGGRQANSRSLTGGAQAQARSPELCTITKANSISTVHRATHLDYVGIKTYDRRGRVTGEHRILGLWAASAYHRSPLNIPLLRRKVSRLIEHFGLSPTSHDSRALVHAIEDYPRDELFQARIEDLIPTIRGIVNLYDRRIVRAFVRRDWFHRYWSCLLYIPRDTYSTSTQTRIESIVREMLKGHAVESRVSLSESSLAQLHLIVHTGPASPPADALAIEARIRAAVLTWIEALAQALVQRCGEGRGADLLARFGRALPAAFQEETSPADAAEDLDQLAATDQPGADAVLRLTSSPQRPRMVNLRLYRRSAPRAVADVVATFENLGLRLLSERPYEISAREGAAYFIQDFELEIRAPRHTECGRSRATEGSADRTLAGRRRQRRLQPTRARVRARLARGHHPSRVRAMAPANGAPLLERLR
jgi:glutamate dehydrogenase